MITLKCIECSKEFEAQRSSAKFCSALCRVKYNNRGVEVAPLSQVTAPTPSPYVNNQEIPLPPIAEKTKLVVDKEGIKEKPSDEAMKRIRLTIDQINKDWGEGTAFILGDRPSKAVEHISSGSLGLDLALGIGGYPKGRIVEIYGPESSGKTTLAIHLMAEAQKKGGKCAIVDAEHAFDASYAENIGVKLDKLTLSQPDYGEQALEVAEKFILSNEFSVVVVDSVAALVPKTELEGSMGDSKMGLHARLMSQALRKMVGSIAKSNTICVFINQLRSKIGVIYGSPDVTTGGNALKYYASVRLDVRRNAQLKDGDEIVGNKTTVKVIKNKVAPPYKMAEFDIMYGRGVDRMGEIVDLAVMFDIIKKSGSWYSHNESKLGQGREAVKDLLEANEELLSEIEQRVTEKITQQ